MKVEVLKKIIKETVREAIQEELKDMLYESFKRGGGSPLTPPPVEPKQPMQPQSTPVDRQALRESYKNIIGETAATLNTSHIGQPLQVTSTDTTSPNSQLPAGEVSMDQIMGLMNK